jgi:hypothetical protein
MSPYTSTLILLHPSMWWSLWLSYWMPHNNISSQSVMYSALRAEPAVQHNSEVTE